MCRLLGFRSIIDGQVHQSLVKADNALKTQSINHPDGWGVAYYLSGSPHIVKSTDMAKNSKLFKKVSGVVSSRTVLAHIRKSTIGETSILNTHPYQYGPWVFAHNGNIKNFDNCKDEIKSLIDPKMSNFILGETDSEVLFYYLLTHIKKQTSLEEPDVKTPELMSILRKAIHDLEKVTGPVSENDAPNTETFLTFLLTNGNFLIGHHGGKQLFYSTHKHACPEVETCPKFDQTCLNPSDKGRVNHLIISSEPTLNENVWNELQPYDFIGVDADLELTIDRVK
jgi:predicted glutamine amidotransferase